MNNENKNSKQKNNTAVIVALIAALVAGILILVIALGSIFSDVDDGESSPYVISTEGLVDTTAPEEGIVDGFGDNIEEGTVAAGGADEQSGTGDSANGGVGNGAGDNGGNKVTKNAAVEYYEQLSPNGDNKLSDHHDNKYIKKISKSYNVDTDLLVAIYSVPDTGNNFVLQFSGAKDSSGNIIKSPDTLEKVYQIDKQGTVSVATGKQTGNVGVSYAEGLLCVNMVKSLVMTQYPEYFTGLE